MFNRIRAYFPRSTIAVVCLLTALTLLFFWRIAFSGMILARGDVYNYFYPLWDVRSAALRTGHIPLWSPDIFMGVPLLANSQLGTFYPPNWLVTPLDAPAAITVSMIAHTIWALLGMYCLVRRTLRLDRIPALLAGVLFGLGGYLGGQSEHINQLQALSWMPWLFWLVSTQPVGTLQSDRRSWYAMPLPQVILFGGAVALQLLAGHPQTVFITLVGIGIYGIGRAFGVRQRRITFDRFYVVRLCLLVALGGLIGLLLAAPQLIPMLELSGLGNRGGGLDPQKVLAFSFTPLLMGRGLLPSYDGLLFGEYIAYSGVIGLGLALIGLLDHRLSLDTSTTLVPRLPYVLLVVIGFLFALGAFNPLNWLLASLPGFSFFRVPARWMALESLGVAVLAGIGLQSLKVHRPRWTTLLVMLAVIGGLAIASTLASKQAVDVTGPAVPTLRTWIGWGVALGTLLLLISGQRWLSANRTMTLLAVAAGIELFCASQVMPFNLTVPSDVYSASRFTIRQMQQYTAEHNPPGRMLSISPLEFDPGDKDALNARYTALGMDALSTRIAMVATKLREVIGPNLGMRWGIPSIDGFDGGLLPTRYYTAFSTLLLPVGVDPSTDGRLREMLALPECRGACIPDQSWLNLSNTRYLITDKTADMVIDGVFYDTALTLSLIPSPQPLLITVDPVFTATAIDVLYSATTCMPDQVCSPLYDGKFPTHVESVGTFVRARWELSAPLAVDNIQLTANAPVTLHAVTLVDTRSTVFQQVALPPWKRVLSSDIKLYENPVVTPRAFFVPDQAVRAAADTATVLSAMRESLTAALAGQVDRAAFVVSDTLLQPSANESVAVDRTVTVANYTPERVELHVTAGDQSGMVVLSDAYYPGWVATVNGVDVPVYRTNVMFRGVAIPAAESTVVFQYHPWWWPVIPLVGLVSWIILIILGLGRFRKSHPFV